MRTEDWLLDRFRRELDDTFRTVFHESRHASVPMNVWADDERLVVTAEVPGVDPDAIEVSVTGDTLVLKIARTEEDVESKEKAKKGQANTTWLRRERARGAAVRSLTLPYRVDAEHVAAVTTDGVLTLTFPRAKEDRPRRITVKAA